MSVDFLEHALRLLNPACQPRSAMKGNETKGNTRAQIACCHKGLVGMRHPRRFVYQRTKRC